MKLSEEVKNLIYKEYNSFKENMYAGKSLEERKKLDQFYTPAEITIKMIESFECESLEGKTILDPCCGSGNLLVACLIAGANAHDIYGNEYDGDMVTICRARIKKVCEELGKEGFNDWQIHQGNALIKTCLNKFDDDYNITILPELLKRRNGLKGGYMNNPEAYAPIEKQREMNKSEAKKLLETKERTDNQSQTNMDDYFNSYED